MSASSIAMLRPVAIAALLAWSGGAAAQSYTSGSTGADGAYAPSCAPTPCTVTEALPTSGTYNYTTVTIPTGVTVQYVRNAMNTPVTMLATGDVQIDGGINLNGADGAGFATGRLSPQPGALGGPGGFNGGNGGIPSGVTGTAGLGPGGGMPSTIGTNAVGGTYGAPATFVSLVPLFGGSGGGGGISSSGGAAGPGAGGGGAIVIASSTRITVNGLVSANGGGTSPVCVGQLVGSGGSGGAIRLAAPLLLGAGTLQANPGAGNCGPVGPGRTRLEAFTQNFSGTVTPAPSVSTPGPVTASTNPGLVNLPTLTVTSINGVSAPATPGGAFASADLTLPQGFANPATVTIVATNTPVGSGVGTSIFVKLIPQTADPATVTVPAANHTGTFSTSTATIGITLPSNQVSVLQAWATMTLPIQIAGLMPSIDGEAVERVMLASDDRTLRLVTRSGKEKRVNELAREDQLRVALAWEAMKEAR